MNENKTLNQLYEESPRHEFGDITLTIENVGGKLRGKFIFHSIEADTTTMEKPLLENGLPGCFGRPPQIIDSGIVSKVVWDERYRTLGHVIPVVEREINELGRHMQNLGARLAQCANCIVFDRCYRIAKLNLLRKQTNKSQNS